MPNTNPVAGPTTQTTPSYDEAMAEIGQATDFDPDKQRQEEDPKDPNSIDFEFKEGKAA